MAADLVVTVQMYVYGIAYAHSWLQHDYQHWIDWARFNVPPNTLQVISGRYNLQTITMQNSDVGTTEKCQLMCCYLTCLCVWSSQKILHFNRHARMPHWKSYRKRPTLKSTPQSTKPEQIRLQHYAHLYI